MKLKIEIDMGNAAFDPCPQIEVSRILRGLSHHLEDVRLPRQGDPVYLLDVNGNRVGFAKVVK